MPDLATRDVARPTVETHEALANERIGAGAFVWIAVQLALVLAVTLLFRMELERGFGVVAPLLLAGFLIHSWLPMRFRVPFFVALTFLSLLILLRAEGLWVIGLGLGLLGLCHLPIGWWPRVALVVLAAAGLVALQAGWLEMPWAGPVISILAAMFMFRIILYLYNLKNEKTPAGRWQRLAYFFMLPNVCFPLFPVVDYKTFLRTHYDAPASEIYQKGVYWMLRGVSHLLLYRIVYHLMPRANAELSGVLGAFVFMVMTYALYLRVSGLFHLIAGSLCLFGFNLPVTNNHYFLASSFTDLWRRINIYWKDFMMTVVFYPVLMGTRRLGMRARLVLGTGIVFLVTWFLHSYQWFWLQGDFPVRAADIGFWGFLGLAVAVTSLWEARHGRRRRLGRTAWSLREAAGVSARTLGVFSSMAVLWSLWYSGSVGEWGFRLARARYSDAVDWSLFAGILVALFLAGVVGQWLKARDWGLDRVEGLAWRHASQLVPALSVALLIVGLPLVHERGGERVQLLVERARSTQANRLDLDRQERGYYETLSRATQFGPSIAGAVELADEGELLFRHSKAVRRTDDIRGYEMIPGAEIAFRGSIFRVNRWGLRDRDYQRDKPAGTYRIALLGSSHVMGWGVGNEQTFENLVEDRLNRELAGQNFGRYEILNFAVAGYALPQVQYVAERIVPRFEPDVVIYVAHPREAVRLLKRLQILLTRMRGELGGDRYVSEVLEKAEAHPELPPAEFEYRLMPYRDELLRRSFLRMVAASHAQGALPVLVLLPLTNEEFEREELVQLSRMAEESGTVVLTLGGVFEGHELERITVSDTDSHANELGHQLVAERLFEELLRNADALGLAPGDTPRAGSRAD